MRKFRFGYIKFVINRRIAMKKIFILTLLIVGNYIYSECPEVLDHNIRILDSSESINLCKYDTLIIYINMTTYLYP